MNCKHDFKDVYTEIDLKTGEEKVDRICKKCGFPKMETDIFKKPLKKELLDLLYQDRGEEE